MRDWLKFAWSLFKSFLTAVAWDAARLLGYPAYLSSESGDPNGWAVHHWLTVQVEALAKILRLPGWCPAQGPLAWIKGSVRRIRQHYRFKRQFKRLRSNIHKATGLRLTDQQLPEYLAWLERELSREQSKTEK